MIPCGGFTTLMRQLPLLLATARGRPFSLMSVKIMSDVFERSKTEGNARLVLLSLADCANDDGACWPSIRKIAEKANLSEPIAKKYLNALIEVGVVRREEREDQSGRQTSNYYTIMVDQIGDDKITRDIMEWVTPKSRLVAREGVTRVSGGGGNTGYRGVGVTRVSLPYMNHHKEPSKEPSDGFVADAPKTMATDLFPTVDSNVPKPSNPQIAERSSMDSRSLQSTITSADFKARANRLLGRRDATAWSTAELRAAKPHFQTCEEDWKLLEKLYAKRGEKDVFTRRSMLTLLNNWAGEIDKARAMFPPAPEIPDEKLDPVAAGKYWANVKPNE
jgi:hypothetical protein